MENQKLNKNSKSKLYIISMLRNRKSVKMDMAMGFTSYDYYNFSTSKGKDLNIVCGVNFYGY